MRNSRLLSFGLLTAFVLCMPVAAQTQEDGIELSRIEPGEKQKIKGVIIGLEGDKLVVRERNGSDIVLGITGATKIVKKKANPTNALLRGLEVEISARGDDSGSLVAEKIRYTNEGFRVARSFDARLGPVETRVTNSERRLDTTENRLTAAEENARRMSGQLDELAAVANTANGGAKAAQETANQALAASKAVSAQIQATNDRISQIDNYEPRQNIALNFRINSAMLSDEAKATLDEIAAQVKNERGYLIQVTGYASADGTKVANRALSERRADAVRRYLAENHDIPLYRIITPFGYGESKRLCCINIEPSH